MGQPGHTSGVAGDAETEDELLKEIAFAVGLSDPEDCNYVGPAPWHYDAAQRVLKVLAARLRSTPEADESK